MPRRPKIAIPLPLELNPSVKDIVRFMSRIEEVDGHWMWKGRVDDNGYGEFDYQGTEVGAHRFSYALFKGCIPGRRHVHHDNCDLHSCVNPAHLKDLTPKQNSRDGARRKKTQPRLF